MEKSHIKALNMEKGALLDALPRFACGLSGRQGPISQTLGVTNLKRFFDLLEARRPGYCSSLVTSCCMLLACASALMPVWLRISYFDMFEVAEA